MTTMRSLLFASAVALSVAVSAPAFAASDVPSVASYQQVTDSYSSLSAISGLQPFQMEPSLRTSTNF
jgi:hypothetical protein